LAVLAARDAARVDGPTGRRAQSSRQIGGPGTG
jgi:hypothetical protein